MESKSVTSLERDIDEFEYVAFIDEAGDPNITRVRPIDEKGGSEWIVLSCVLIRRANFEAIEIWHKEMLSILRITQTNHIHFRKLNDRQRLEACSYIAQLPIRLFVVASNKRTMRGHQNPRAEIRGAKQWFYNWMIRLLLERVTHYCARRSKRDGVSKFVKLVFATTGKHSYSQTEAYHAFVEMQARADNVFLDLWVPDYSTLKSNSISTFLARDVTGLQLSDVVASAFHWAVDNLDTGPCNPTFAMQLKPRVALTPGGSNMNYGINLQPTSSYPLAFQLDQRAIFEHFGYGFDADGYVL